MNTIPLKIFVSDSLGSVSAEIIEAENPRCMMTLAHGAGADMNHSFMSKLALELAQVNISTLRFNLHYMEQKKKRPDPPAVAHAVIRAVIIKAHELYPHLPLFVSGKSFGGRMTSQLMAKENLAVVKGIVFFGFPLHPAGQPGTERATHLSEVKVPMLFLQGTKDTLANLPLIEEVTRSLSSSTLLIIENADHSFKVKNKDAIVDLSKKTEKWLDSIHFAI